MHRERIFGGRSAQGVRFTGENVGSGDVPGSIGHGRPVNLRPRIALKFLRGDDVLPEDAEGFKSILKLGIHAPMPAISDNIGRIARADAAGVREESLLGEGDEAGQRAILISDGSAGAEAKAFQEVII